MTNVKALKDPQESDKESLPMISVIIPNYNGEKVLPYCLDSLLKQTYKNFEIIVVDNGSADKSLEIIKGFANRSDIKITLIPLKRNLGYSAAITIGAKYAKGKYILATNNDIIFDGAYLENLVKGLEALRRKDPTIVAASGIHFYYPEKDIINYAGGGLSLISGYYMFYQRPLSQLSERELKYLNTFRYIAFPTGAGALIDRSIFLHFKGYYYRYFSGAEEFDFGITLYKFRYKAVHIPNAILYHMESFTLGGRGILLPNKLFLIMRNLLILYFRHYDVCRLLAAILIHMTASFSLILLGVLRNRPEIIYSVLRAYRFFIKYDLKYAKRDRILYSHYNNDNKILTFDQVVSILKKYGAYLPFKKMVKKYILQFLNYLIY